MAPMNRNPNTDLNGWIVISTRHDGDRSHTAGVAGPYETREDADAGLRTIERELAGKPRRPGCVLSILAPSTGRR